MKFTDLANILAELRHHGVASAEVPTPDGPLRVVFTTDEARPLPGDVPSPGGWKSPTRLDDPSQYEEAP